MIQFFHDLNFSPDLLSFEGIDHGSFEGKLLFFIVFDEIGGAGIVFADGV